VICPDADVKLFVTATDEVRAGRRHRELLAAGYDTGYDEVLADLRARDERDSARAEAPLEPARDAVVLDTSEMDIDTAVARAIEVITRAQG
jgi:cytidylate kinase